MDVDLESQRLSNTAEATQREPAVARSSTAGSYGNSPTQTIVADSANHASRRSLSRSSTGAKRSLTENGATLDSTPPTPESRRSTESRLQSPNNPLAAANGRISPTFPTQQSTHADSPSHNGSTCPGAAVSDASSSINSSNLDDEEIGLFDFAEDLRREKPPGEPWFMEMTRLRRVHFLWLNKELAAIRKKILEDRRASGDDMKRLQDLLRDQASAIRDFQYIRSLDFLSSGQMEQRRKSSIFYFPQTAKSVDDNVFPFETENYRCLPRAQKTALEPFSDEVREFMRTYLPSRITWTKAEIEAKRDWFDQGYAPATLSPTVDRLARFTIAMAGALFILVPMYIMAIHQNPTKNLVTTTVAVVLFALLCSVTLRTSNDQTLGATAGYAAVLMVFVGLTSSPNDTTS